MIPAALNQYPGILSGFAGPGGIRSRETLDFHEVLIAAAQDWPRDPELAEWPYSPFEVISPMLATETMDHVPDTRPSGSALTRSTRRPCARAPPGPRTCLAEARNPIEAGRGAIKAIGESLRYPAGMFGRPSALTNVEPGPPCSIETISRLGEIAREETVDPAVVIAIRAALWWHAQYSDTATRTAARAVWAHLPETALHLALVLHDGWGQFLSRGRTSRKPNPSGSGGSRKPQTRPLQPGRTRNWSTGSRNDSRSNDWCSAVEAETPAPLRGPWLTPGLGRGRRSAVASQNILNPCSVTLSGRPESPGDLLGRRCPTAGTGSPRNARSAVACHVAEAYGLSIGARDTILEEEADLLRSLATLDGPQVRRFTVIAAQRIARASSHPGDELAMSVRLGDSAGVAEEVAAIFGQHGFLSWADLAPDLASHLLDQLRECPSIDGYQVGVLLAEITRMTPTSFLSCSWNAWTGRVPAGGLDGYDPLPRIMAYPPTV